MNLDFYSGYYANCTLAVAVYHIHSDPIQFCPKAEEYEKVINK